VQRQLNRTNFLLPPVRFRQKTAAYVWLRLTWAMQFWTSGHKRQRKTQQVGVERKCAKLLSSWLAIFVVVHGQSHNLKSIVQLP
jgi:hypothetical protein